MPDLYNAFSQDELSLEELEGALMTTFRSSNIQSLQRSFMFGNKFLIKP